MKQAHWEHFSYGADIGVRGIGSSKKEAFAQAALALTAVITDPDTVVPTDELLFVDWLNALVYEKVRRSLLCEATY